MLLAPNQPFSDYFYSILPILAGNVLITPHSVVTGSKRYWSEWELLLRQFSIDVPPDFMEENLIFSKNKFFERRKWWTIITHMFVHLDYDHLLSNMAGLCLAGRRVREVAGAGWLAAAYLAGGAAGALDPAGLKALQVSNQMREKVRIQESPGHGYWRGLVSRTVNESIGSMTTTIAPHMQKHINYLGASNGISSLMGMKLCFRIEDIWKLIENWRHATPGDIFVLYSMIGEAAGIIAMVSTQSRRVRKPIANIDYAGHLISFGVGIGCYFAFKFSSWIHTKKRKKGGRIITSSL